MVAQIKQYAKKQLNRMIEYRRYLHMHPCTSFNEEETVLFIKERLSELGIPFRDCGKNGILARITSDKNGPCIAFRADIDALKIQEANTSDYISRTPGVMHACGHDAHTATLLGLAHILSENNHLIKGEVVLIFQYAEEQPPGGAKPMILDGCLDGVDKIYGYHVSDELPSGVVGVCKGSYMSASDCFSIEINGSGGHGSRPYETVDTVSAAASTILNINNIVSRFVPAIDPAVISICSINGGSSYNVMPEKIRLEGTARSYEKTTAELLENKIGLAVKSACELYGAQYLYRYENGYPVLVNSEVQSSLVLDIAQRLKHKSINIPRTPVSEDFAYYLQSVPGCFFRVGVNNAQKGFVYPLHNNRFDLDETHMLVAVECFLGIYLAETQDFI